TSIAVAWSPATDDVGVAGYGLYNGGSGPIATTTATSYVFGSLGCGKAYTLGVDAFDAAGNRSGQTQINASTGACPAAVGLVAAYGFNEGSGATVTDLSGSGNNGTISGATWCTRSTRATAAGPRDRSISAVPSTPWPARAPSRSTPGRTWP